jgi:tripartite-type tricarboxylate transporter receptor subunit TctC
MMATQEQRTHGWLLRLVSVLAGIALSFAAHAQSYPSAPVHILVPYPPGGAVDIIARTLGESSAASGARPSSSRTARVPAA